MDARSKWVLLLLGGALAVGLWQCYGILLTGDAHAG